jgi:uncharacterized protein YcfJ
MNAMPITQRIHPLMAGAAVSVTLASLVAIAAMTGLLPNSHGSNSPAATGNALPTADAAAPLPQYQYQTQVMHRHNLPAVQHVRYDGPVQQMAASAPVQAAVQTQSASQVTPTATTTPATPVVSAAPATQVQNTQQVAYNPPAEPARSDSAATTPVAQKPTSGIGIATGAVIGGLIGNQIGGGSGRTLATIAGALGGGFFGNEVEKRTRQ